jgi:adenylate kinase|tara:strand:+ start:1977 stop:2519 length:543 start_codon:yes stop_codon:yes gene_type:complete
VTVPYRLSLSGSPGSGKSTLAKEFERLGFHVVSVEEIAEEHNCIGEIDSSDNARPIDLDKLVGLIEKEWENSPREPLIIDGHLSHHLPSDAVVVLRCSPDILEKRMIEREYSESKIRANCDWEILGSSWNEREGDIPWIEFDTTKNDVHSILMSLSLWISDGFKPNDPASVIDWVSKMED